MNQGGVKHAPADQPRLDNKRERRRGAAGRAAALRRAPSDSDCSGETASLSADSGDRVLRPQPQPPRSGKSRSRRRGSEWEVLEGLKDGQRFDKRPDVFNGYLHKKRKWPLKGWHKRFFVVDGGILVYARSPTDVARGRLHGSVDVGLSVISAKARRRRIDIDADEFIYHLRAKTPDVFRTWLNVLKAHRLYRQHLLTFGARESVPKIHAPLDDLPPTDTSSRASNTSSEMSSNSEDYVKSHASKVQNVSATNSIIQRQQNNILTKDNESKKNRTKGICLENCITKNFQNKFYNKSLCSMNCARRLFANIDPIGSADVSNGSTETEKQMHSTELDNSSFKCIEPGQNSVPICETTLNSDSASLRTLKRIGDYKMSNISQTNVFKDTIKKEKTSIFTCKGRPTNAYFLFTRNKICSQITESPMKRSRKSTNLIKYKNIINEPPLKKPLSKCMLLKKYKLKASKQVVTDKGHNRAVACDPVSKENNEIQVNIDNKANKKLQHVATASDYDRITERLMVTIFERHNSTVKGDEVKYYVNQVVRDLYDDKTNQEEHPVKALFKSLLEYWLKHTSFGQIKEAMTKAKSIEKPSNKHFTKDENLSSTVIDQTCKETQFHGLSDIIAEFTTRKNIRHTHRITTENKNPIQYHNPRHDTESFEKEKRIQELEKLLKNTVYICETGLSPSREKDIKITKTLISNIGKFSSRFDDKTDETANDTSNSSSELPGIQKTINKLISETSIPPDVAKEFFNAYLDVLRHDSSRSGTNTSTQSSDNVDDTKRPICEVRTETIVKKISKSVTTLKPADVEDPKVEKSVDPGQMYLKDVLDKITTIFSKVKKSDDKPLFSSVKEELKKENKIDVKDELARLIKDNGKEIICEKVDENSLVIDLSKYNLENITMADDPATKGTMSINIKLKEKFDKPKAKRAHLSLKFSNDSKPQIKTNNWFPCKTPSYTSDDIFNRFTVGNTKPFDCSKEIVDLKPYISTSDGTSKAFKFMNDSEDSLNISFNHNIFQDRESFENDMKPCFIMSTMKKNKVTKFQTKKKVRLKDGIALDSKTDIPLTPSEHNEEVKVFEKPTPRIIDEKFILLLLENLTLLSKGVPSIHKEISNLFAKLKKKCEKIVKTSPNVQGLSLLGKIYNETIKLNDHETQFEDDGNTVNQTNLKQTLNIGVNTKTDDKVVTNKSITTLHLTKEVANNYVQTEEVNKTNKSSTRIDYLVANVAQNKNITETKESATSNHNWRGTHERAVTTIVKSIPNTDNETYHNTARPINIDTDMLKRRKYVPKPPEEIIKEISILSPSLKVSKQSQTERMMVVLRDRDVDMKVYQMLLCQNGPTRRSSLTDSNAEVSWSDELKTLYRCTSDPYCSGLISPTSPPIRGPQFVSGTPGGRLASWIIESGGPLENASRELGQAQLSIQQLQRLLDALELQQQVHHDTDVSLEGASPNVKKDRRKFGLRKKKSNSKCASVELAPPHVDPSSSHMALSALTAPPSPGGGASSVPNSAASLPIACAAARPQSLPGAEALGPTAGPASISSLTPDHQLREDFTVLAKDLLASLKSIVATLVCERGRLRAAMEAADSTGTPGGSVMAALRTNLTSALQQNSGENRFNFINIYCYLLLAASPV
ncbi:hypothetical protein O3G_MSEX007274 [Manduca sexta]|uniref:PH domain-containing protein n=1 Tax=Manduca sexta TaxID=7130 RepID=A0A922CMR6_MANSE|nr:hypothetical protein O3G_MSEX007274 [Manduca sexta]